MDVCAKLIQSLVLVGEDFEYPLTLPMRKLASQIPQTVEYGRRIKYATISPHLAELFSIGGSSLAFYLGDRIKPWTLGTLGEAILSCEHLRQAMTTFSQHEVLVQGVGKTTIDISPNETRVTWHHDVTMCDAARFIQVMMLGIILRISGWLSWQSGAVVEVALPVQFGKTLMLDLPASYPIFHTEKTPYVVFSTSALNQVLPQYNARKYHQSVELLQKELQALKKFNVVNRVEQIIVVMLRLQKRVSLESVSKILHCSESTLKKHLYQQGCRFRDLYERVRIEHARYLLQSSQLTVSEIAFQLGYQEQSSFTHAYKKWHGQTPSQFRKQVSHHKSP